MGYSESKGAKSRNIISIKGSCPDRDCGSEESSLLFRQKAD